MKIILNVNKKDETYIKDALKLVKDEYKTVSLDFIHQKGWENGIVSTEIGINSFAVEEN